jgi:hypothetical protein
LGAAASTGDVKKKRRANPAQQVERRRGLREEVTGGGRKYATELGMSGRGRIDHGGRKGTENKRNLVF